MGVTRLKRKDRKNKTVSRLLNESIKRLTTKEIGSRSLEKASSQTTKNNALISELEAELKAK